MRLYIIRHADPDYANDTITELGHREAAALAEHLRSVKLDHLFTSPMGRARATAGYTAKVKGLEPTVLPWTAELGHWKIEQPQGSGSTACVWDIHGHHVRGRQPLPGHDWHLVPPFDNPMFRSEYEALGRKSDAWLAEFGYVHDGGVYRVERSNRDALAVFCHGGFGLTWLAYLLAIPLPLMWTGFFLSPTSVTTLLFDERGDGLAVPRCIGMGERTHLHAAGLHNARVPGGIKANYE